MKTQKMFLDECNHLKVPKYIQSILLNSLVLSKSNVPDSYLLHCSKHLSRDVLSSRHRKTVDWVRRHGGKVIEPQYDTDKEFCGDRDKYYPINIRFSAYSKYKCLFSHIPYN